MALGVLVLAALIIAVLAPVVRAGSPERVLPHTDE